MFHRRHSALPDIAQERLRRLGVDIRSGRNLTQGIEEVLAEFDLLSPALAVAADGFVARRRAARCPGRRLQVLDR
jgi:hypothetical protein